MRPCIPSDAITAAAATDPAAQSACLKSCSEREITYKTTTSETYIEALDELVEFAGNTTQYFPGNTTHNFSGNAMQNFSSADITILQLYFSTFESPVYHLTEERWPDFLCKDLNDIVSELVLTDSYNFSHTGWTTGSSGWRIGIVIRRNILFLGEIPWHLSPHKSREEMN